MNQNTMKLLTPMITVLLMLSNISINGDEKMAQDSIQIVDILSFENAQDLNKGMIVNDTVMGGVSESKLTTGTQNSVIFKGNVSLENNGGFASVRFPVKSLTKDDCTGIFFRIRGDGKTYKLIVLTRKTDERISYQSEFKTVPGETTDFFVEFSNFIPTFRGRIVSDAPPLLQIDISKIGFLISNKQEGEFKLEIMTIGTGKRLPK